MNFMEGFRAGWSVPAPFPGLVHLTALNCSLRCPLLSSPTLHLLDLIPKCQFAGRAGERGRSHPTEDRENPKILSVLSSGCFNAGSSVEGEEGDEM